MAEPTTIKQVIHILDWCWRFISMGLAFTVLWHFAEGIAYGWWKRPPERTMGGFLEPWRESETPEIHGAISEAAGGLAGLAGGLVLYTVLSFIVIIGGALSVLLTGVSIPTQEFLYASAAAAVLYTLVVQEEIRQEVAQSKWYLGY